MTFDVVSGHYVHFNKFTFVTRAPPSDRHGSVSDADSDEENEEGDYTVYECPGLAPVSISLFCQKMPIVHSYIYVHDLEIFFKSTEKRLDKDKDLNAWKKVISFNGLESETLKCWCYVV